MVGMVLTDSEDEPRIERPTRRSKPTAALLHSGEPTLPFQQKAVQDFRAAEASKRAAERQLAIDSVRAKQTTTPCSSRATSPETASSVAGAPVPSTSHVLDKSKRARVEEIADDEESGDEERENARFNPKRMSVNCSK
jgi:hypothetical protein